MEPRARQSADDAVEEDLLLRVRLDHEAADVQQPENDNPSHNHRRDPVRAHRHEALGGNQQQGRIDEEQVSPAVDITECSPMTLANGRTSHANSSKAKQIRGADGIARSAE